MLFLIIILSLTSTLYIETSAQSGPFEPTSPDATCVHISSANVSDICRPFLDYEFIYNDKYSDARSKYIEFILANIDESKCKLLTARYICSQFYRKCTNVAIDNQIHAVSSFTCRHLCEAHLEPCQYLIPDELKKDLSTCHPAPQFVYGNVSFDVLPIKSNNITINNFTFEMECYSGSENVTVEFIPICPEGTHASPNGCLLNCPEPLITDSEFYSITTMISIISWISLIMMIFLIASHLIDPIKRKIKHQAPLYFFISIAIFNFAFCFESLYGYNDILCSDNEPNVFGNPACTFQGILIVYSSLAAASWWFIICINLFIVLLANARNLVVSPKFILISTIGSHIYAWGLPALIVIVALGMSSIGSNGSQLWCTIHSTDKSAEYSVSGSNNSDLNHMLLFWMPMILMIVIGIGAFILGILINLSPKHRQKLVKMLKKQYRVFIFIAIYVWICIFMFSFDLDFIDRKNDQYEAYQNNIQCLRIAESRNAFREFQLAIGATLIEPKIECDLETYINFPLWVIACFNFVGQGIFVFLVFGTNKRVYVIWRDFWNPHIITDKKKKIEMNHAEIVPHLSLSSAERSDDREL